ncbi:MAG TPA: penicillin-binding protein 1B [Gammaproteobacteria bacterium]|nr:penicillin-binding protein 1B [Gammaproteobacteria bacterium]
MPRKKSSSKTPSIKRAPARRKPIKRNPVAKKPAGKKAAAKKTTATRPVKKKTRRRKKTTKSRRSSRLLKMLLSRLFLSSIALGAIFTGFYLLYLNIIITDKMSGRIWSLPSHVYARPLEVYQDRQLSVEDLKQELALLDYHRVNRRPENPGQYRILNSVLNGAHFEIITRDGIFWDGKRKSRGLRLSIHNNQVQGLYELHTDKTIALFRFEAVKMAGIYPAKKEERQLIKLADIPDELVLALLAVEDRRFYQHHGIDIRSIFRAMVANLMAGKAVQGGSTLTQQLVKNLFLSPERTLLRKINEAIMAVLLEMNYDKSVILETYINEVYLAQNGAQQIHGFELASQFYFATPLNNLSKDRIALLVGLVKGPSWYSPRKHGKRALKRRNQVLKLMHNEGILTSAQFTQYKLKPIGLAKKPRYTANRFPAVIDLVKRQLKQDYDDDDLKSSGLKIFTSIDPLIQKKAEASVRKLLPGLERRKKVSSELQTSVIVASSQQGEIQAIVSDRNPDFPGFNRSLDAVRQIGSLIKPAVYLTALQQPDKYTLATLLDDSPLHIKTAKDKRWSPRNYDGTFKGPVPLYESLKLSRNIPSVRLGLAVGLADIAETLNNLGVRRDIPAYPSMTLGAFNLSPLDVANMYQTFAAGGFHVPLKVIREVLNKDGEPLKRYPLESEKTLDERSVFLVNYVLSEVTKSGTAKSLAKQIPETLAGKTGTTDDLRDSWFAGFSNDQLAIVWLGRDDNTSTGLTGSSGALRLWTDIMKKLPVSSLSLAPPNGVEMRWIDPESGALSGKNCQGAVELPFIHGSAPTEKSKCKTGGLLYQIKRLFD